MGRISRKSPKPPFWDAGPGICRGCGEEFLTKVGERARNRRWCDSCREAWRIAGHPTRARAAVFARDKGKCHDCGTDCTSYLTTRSGAVPQKGGGCTYRVQINRERALEWCARVLGKTENPRNPQSEYTIDLGEWHVDHAMPLHLIDREAPEAWREWTLPNLRTRCPVCHKKKTAHEAKMRGKVRRLNGTTKKKPGKKIAQRANPWPKGRKMRSRGFSNFCPDEAPVTLRWLTDAELSEEERRRLAIMNAEQLRRDHIQSAHRNPPAKPPVKQGWPKQKVKS